MNSKNSMLSMIAAVVIAGGWIAFNSGVSGRVIPPDPTPTPAVEGLAKLNANGTATWAAAEEDNWLACAAKIDAGDFKTTDEAFKFLKDANDVARAEAFKPMRQEIQKSVDKGLPELSAALKDGAKGFKAAIRGP